MAHKLSGVESLGISKMGQIVLARLMESQIWHQLGSVVLWGEGLEKGQWPLLTLMQFLPVRHWYFSSCHPVAGALYYKHLLMVLRC